MNGKQGAAGHIPRAVKVAEPDAPCVDVVVDGLCKNAARAALLHDVDEVICEDGRCRRGSEDLLGLLGLAAGHHGHRHLIALESLLVPRQIPFVLLQRAANKLLLLCPSFLGDGASG